MKLVMVLVWFPMVLGRFSPESFRPWVVSARVVSAKFGGSFRPDFVF